MTLYPYQTEGVAWLAPRRTALLADEMGLGKTPQALMAAQLPVLVVCPAIARVHWQREAERWRGWRTDVITGAGKWGGFPCVQFSKDASRVADVTVVSYNGLENENIFLYLTAQRWGTLILDEAHYLKSPTALRTKNVLGKGGLAHHADRTWCLTGTPMPNHPGELWPMMYVLGATTLRYAAWAARFCRIDDTGKIRGAKQSAIPELRELLKPFCLRRTKKGAGMQLPPLTINALPVEAGEVPNIEEHFTAVAARVNLDMTRLAAKLEEMVAAEEGKARVAVARGADLSGFIESTPTLRRYVGLQKVEAIAALVNAEMEAGAYDKLVIFCWHKAVINELKARLRQWGAESLYGGTPEAKKQAIIDDFQNRKKPAIILANLNTAGTAISLTAAHQVIFTELDWVPGNNAQAAARCHRHGQEMPVTARVAYLPGTLDEQIQWTLARKLADQAALGLV